MTAHELARVLLEGPDLMVTVGGYEGGVNEIERVRPPRPIHLNINTGWYYGKHDYHEDGRCIGSGDVNLEASHAAPEDQAIHIV